MLKSINSLMTWIITIFIVIITTIIASFSIYNTLNSHQAFSNILRERMVEDNKNIIKYETQTAMSIIEYYYNKEMKGEITREEAMLKAADSIRTIRYGNSGYFFIYDINGNTVAFLGKDLENKNKLHNINSNGNHYIKNLIESTKNKPYGDFTTVKINKPYGDGEQDKIVYTRLFTPYNWIVGTGLYSSDMEEDILPVIQQNEMYGNRISMFILFLSILLCVFSYFAINKFYYIINKPLNHITDRMTRISTGDLNTTKDDEFSDKIFSDSLNEFARLNKASNIIAKNLTSILGFTSNSINKIINISKKLNLISNSNSEYLKSINKTINDSYEKYEYELDSITILHKMVEKDKAYLSETKDNVSDTHNGLRTHSEAINSIKDMIHKMNMNLLSNKAKNKNTINAIKEIISSYDRIDSTINLSNTIISQINNYLTDIKKTMDPNNTSIKDINNLIDLNIKNQETVNNIHSIIFNSKNGYDTIINSIYSEVGNLDSSIDYISKIDDSLNDGLDKVSNTCKDLNASINNINHIICDLDINYVALDEINTKFKNINKEIQLVINYSNDMNSNMDQLSDYINQLNSIIEKINTELKNIEK